MINEIPLLNTDMTSKYSGDLKNQLNKVLSQYNKIAQDFKKSKIAQANKKQDIQTKDKNNNTLSKKYRQNRLNDNIRLSAWFETRYDYRGQIRTMQTGVAGNPGTQYQQRIQRLYNFYHRRFLFSTNQLDDFNNWYNTRLSITVVVDGNTNTTHFEEQNERIQFQDISLQQLSSNTYPAENQIGGYSSILKDNYGNDIYQLSKYQYVIDYPTNIVSYDSYTYTSVNYNEIINSNPYRTNQQIKYNLYEQYKNIMIVRNNIRSDYLNRRNKKQLYIRYVNTRLNNIKDTIKIYNLNLSTYIRNQYLSEISMAGSVYDQLELDDSFIWCNKVINLLQSYHVHVYPPSTYIDGYGQNFYESYTFQD